MNNENNDFKESSFINFFNFRGLTSFPFVEQTFDAINTYQLLSKIVEYLNTVINQQNIVIENVNELIKLYNELKGYVDTYFDNLDIQEEINIKLDIMAEDGTLAKIINEEIFTELNTKIANLDDTVIVLTNNVNELDAYSNYQQNINESVESYENSSIVTYTKINNTDLKNEKIKPKIGIAGDDITKDIVELPSDFAKRKNTVFTCNAGRYDMENNKNQGLLMIDSVILDDVPYTSETYYDLLCFNAEGNMFFMQTEGTSIQDVINAGGTDCVQGFVRLVENGVNVVPDSVETDRHPRQCISQDIDGNYFFISTCGREINNSLGVTYDELAQMCLDKGAVMSYALDGGGSVSTINNQVKQNISTDLVNNSSTERAVKNFIYFSNDTDTRNSTSVILKEINRLKKFITNITSYSYRGLLQLFGDEAVNGIEFFEAAETTRYAKIKVNTTTFYVYNTVDSDTGNMLLRVDANGITDNYGKYARNYVYGYKFENFDFNAFDEFIAEGSININIESTALNNPVPNSVGMLERKMTIHGTYMDVYYCFTDQSVRTRVKILGTSLSAWKTL